MNKKYRTIGLCAALLFQFCILVTEYASAMYPIWHGKEIRLKTEPLDPRSMFRGNYARLRYKISSISGEKININRNIRNDEVVFVKLRNGENGIYSYDGVSLEKPQNGIFIRGRIKKYASRNLDRYRVIYGIEAFFAPKEKALYLEKLLRKNAIAVIMVDNNGKAALKDVVENR